MKQLAALGVAVVLALVATASLWPSRGDAPTMDAARAKLGLGAPQPLVKVAPSVAGSTAAKRNGGTGAPANGTSDDDPEAPAAETDESDAPPAAEAGDWLNRPKRPTRFDVEQAMARVENAVLACRSLEEASGTITVKLEFATTGAVTSASVMPPFAGTKTGQCVSRAASAARLPTFSATPTPTIQVIYPYYFAPNE